MLVLAGPGSGKTFTITKRIQYLIEEHHVSPEHILVITFTKAAALEMQKRFYDMVGDGRYFVRFGTFHAVFFQILKHTYSFHASSIIKESEKRSLLKEIIHNIPKEIRQMDDTDNSSNEDSAEQLQALLSEISKRKTGGLTAEPSEAFSYIYEQYTRIMKAQRKIDFDDMMLLCCQLLEENNDILRLWQEKFTYLLIDEFQDINPLQYKIIRMLAAPQNNLFAVGDDDQAIYGFRGSSPELMLRFQEDYPNAKQVLLHINYRSRSDIVEAANALITHNKRRFPKQVEALQKGRDSVRFFCFPSKQEQAKNIVRLITQYKSQPGTHYRDIAIIFRTNTYAVMTAERLVQEEIPFQMKEKGRNPYDSETARDILAYVTFAQNREDVKSFYRIMNRPVRYIRRDTVPTEGFSMQELIRNNKGRDYVIQNIIQLYRQLDFMRDMSPFAAVNFIRKGVGYEDDKMSQEKKEELDRLQESAKKFDTLKEWLLSIEHYKEEWENAEQEKEDAVSIMTMHASKGLEFPIVILPDVNEGHIPHKKAISEEELEEERRMLFVAMTRAKEKLFFFYIRESKEKEAGNILPSRFIKEIIHEA